MSAVITKIDISDKTKSEYVAQISIDEIRYKGIIEIVYRIENGGPIFLSAESKKNIVDIGYNISTVKGLIRDNMLNKA